MQNITIEPTAIQTAKPCLTFNMAGVDEIFQGFTPGDFAVLYGSPSVNTLTSLICIRAQLPQQLGGLGGNVVFIDGGITLRLYNIARLAQLHQLNPEKALEKIFISRAFTAHQLTALIMEKMEEAVKIYDAKVAIISDISGFFLDTNVATEEAQRIYSQILSYLADFARKHQIVVIATYLPHENSKRNTTLRQMTHANASTVLYFTKTPYGKQVALEKHPTYPLGLTKLPSETTTLSDFVGDTFGQDN